MLKKWFHGVASLEIVFSTFCLLFGGYPAVTTFSGFTFLEKSAIVTAEFKKDLNFLRLNGSLHVPLVGARYICDPIRHPFKFRSSFTAMGGEKHLW